MTPLLRGYIDSLFARGEISEATLQRAEDVIAKVESVPNGSVFSFAPGPDGMVEFNWRIENHAFSLELYADGHYEAYDEDLLLKEMWSKECKEIPAEFLRWLAETSERSSMPPSWPARPRSRGGEA